MADAKLTEILSPATLAKIDNYHLMAKIAVESFLAGMHRSIYRGSGSEFLQYRNYTPGDDLKYLDWKVFARSNRYYTKVYQEETNFTCNIILDASASMAYQGSHSPCSKFRYGAMLGACLAYLACRQGDDVGFFAYNHQLAARIPPARSSGHLQRILTAAGAIKPEGRADHGKFLPYFAEIMRRRGMVIIISDFLDTDSDPVAWLKKLRLSRHDCLALQVLDNDELEFPFTHTVRFIDSETGAHIVTAPQSVRDDYLKRLRQFLADLRKSCLDGRIEYHLTDTRREVGGMLAAYLHRRGAVYGC